MSKRVIDSNDGQRIVSNSRSKRGVSRILTGSEFVDLGNQHGEGQEPPMKRKKGRVPAAQIQQQQQQQQDHHEEELAPAEQCFRPCTGLSSKDKSMDHQHDGNKNFKELIALFHQRLDETPIIIFSRVFDILSEEDEFHKSSCRACDAGGGGGVGGGEMLPSVRLHYMQTLGSILLVAAIERCCRSDAVHAILAAMEHFPESRTVQIEAFRLLQRLWNKPPLVASPQEEDEKLPRPLIIRILNDVLTTLRRNPDNAIVQCMGLDVLRRLKSRLESQNDLVHGVVTILAAMRRHQGACGIHQVALSVMAWLAEVGVCREAMLEADGLETITTSMRTHVMDAVVQCNAAATLSWLVHASRGQVRGQRQQQQQPVALNAQHVPIILNAMVLHIPDPCVFGNCVCLLCSVAQLDDEEVVLDIIRGGMELHLPSPKVQECCLRWIRFRNLAACENGLRRSLPIILRAMQKHPADGHLQAQACDVLAVFVELPALRSAMLEQGAIDVVLECAQRHRHNLQVKQGAIWFLTVLLPSPAMGGDENDDGEAAITAAFGGGFSVIGTIWDALGTDGHEDL